MPIELICNYCGDTYSVAPYREDSSNYCSSDCYTKAQSDYTTTQCEQCEENFRIRSWKIDTYDTKYCSRSCVADSKKNGLTKNCEQCGEEFYIPRHREGSARFCDKYCKKKYETADYDRGKDSGQWATFSRKYRNWVGECESCGGEPEHVHHNNPIFKGGGLWDNSFTVLCKDCHLGDYGQWH